MEQKLCTGSNSCPAKTRLDFFHGEMEGNRTLETWGFNSKGIGTTHSPSESQESPFHVTWQKFYFHWQQLGTQRALQ